MLTDLVLRYYHCGTKTIARAFDLNADERVRLCVTCYSEWTMKGQFHPGTAGRGSRSSSTSWPEIRRSNQSG